MNDLTPTDRQALREYLLETLSPEERDRVEARILESHAWQEALELERAALAVLDELPEAEPPDDLADRTIQAVEEAAEAKPERHWYEGSWATLAATLAVVGILGAILIPALSRSREASRRASAQNNMKQIGLAMKMYANESPSELWPPMSPYKDVWMFDLERLYPKYLPDLSVLVDPTRSDAGEILKELSILSAKESPDWERMTRLAARSFTYVGWAVMTADDAEVLTNQYALLSSDQLERNLGTDMHTVYRLREGIERFLITDINNPAASAMGQSEIPVLIRNTGSNRADTDVLYLDGHVSRPTSDSETTAVDWLLETLPHLSRPD